MKLFEQAVNLNPVASHHAAFAASLAPDNPDHRFIFAYCLRKNGALEHALFLYRALLEKWPEMTRVHFDIGQVLSLLKRPAEAKVAYRKALELNPIERPTKKSGLAQVTKGAGV